jgi:predicted transposase YbfD/YdcC
LPRESGKAVMVVGVRPAGGQEHAEVRYYLRGRPLRARRLAQASRARRGIENSRHWILDVAFREDESRVRKQHGPENLAILHRLARSILKRDSTKVGIRCQR